MCVPVPVVTAVVTAVDVVDVVDTVDAVFCVSPCINSCMDCRVGRGAGGGMVSPSAMKLFR